MPMKPTNRPITEDVKARKFRKNVDGITWRIIRKGRRKPNTSRKTAATRRYLGCHLVIFEQPALRQVARLNFKIRRFLDLAQALDRFRAARVEAAA